MFRGFLPLERTKALRADDDDPMNAVVAVGPATRKRSADWNFMVLVLVVAVEFLNV
jgi:hypothetical protein